MEQKKNIVLVAGGAGFIGSHLCERLLNDGYEVICLDNLYTGRIDNISHILTNKHFTFVNHDVTMPYIATGLSMIFNLACPASPVHYQKDAVYTTKTAFLGTLNMLELARNNDCIMLQASTSEVYGNPLVHPQPETYWGNVNPIGIRSCYDEGKRIGETLCMDYHRQYGTKVKIVRIFNTYGPRMAENDGRVVSNFIIQALRGEDITVYGDGSQTRSFQYVSDIINGFVNIVKTDDSFTGPINLGNPEEYTVKELAETIIKLTGSHSYIEYKPLPKDDPIRRKPIISKAEKQFGWKPQVTLHDGLSSTICYFKKQGCINTKSIVNG
ncbi:MAG: SDR family oxidoreductase [Bacteroidaceae bacterium]|nr:SDR family oxidoreductase [Bacteroidaceae bacterium]